MDSQYFLSEDGVTWPSELTSQTSVRLNYVLYGGESAYFGVDLRDNEYIHSYKKFNSYLGVGNYTQSLGNNLEDGTYYPGYNTFVASNQLTKRYGLSWNAIHYKEGLSNGTYGYEIWFDDELGKDVYLYLLNAAIHHTSLAANSTFLFGVVDIATDFATVSTSDLLLGVHKTLTDTYTVVNGSIVNTDTRYESTMFYLEVPTVGFSEVTGESCPVSITVSSSSHYYGGDYSYNPKNKKLIAKFNSTTSGHNLSHEFTGFAIREPDIIQQIWQNFVRTAEVNR